jgi:hypothetical protein
MPIIAIVGAASGASYGLCNGSNSPTNTVAPAVTGVAKTTRTLSVTTGIWTNSPSSYSYQWQQDNTTNISSANSSTYVVQNSDVGHTLNCRITATNAFGSSTANSNSTASVTYGVYSATYFMIGGGGGGGSGNPAGGGGGGAGQYLYSSTSINVGDTYNIVVGTGGGLNSAGQASSFGSITANGGGAGSGSGQGGAAGNGASGGSVGGTSSLGGGGGGGASGAGGSGYDNGSDISVGGNGGGGVSNTLTGSTLYYGGGGGGGGYYGYGTGSTGGGNGGKASPTTGDTSATAGAANSGSGGGGFAYNRAAGSTNGGSGAVVISVPSSFYTGTYTGSSVIVSTNGSNTVLQFLANGSYTA